MSDDEEDTICPLCSEEMDLSDKNFLPCPCGYRICIWCWHHIRDNLNGLCPACRTPYNPDPHVFSAVDRQEIVKKNKERKQKEKQEKKVADKPVSNLVTNKPVIQTIADRRHLHNYRVVQRNLIYVVGIPSSMANEDLLRKPEYFGQYGKIGKVVVHKNQTSTVLTVSAYITFVHKDDAKAAIQALEGYWVEGHLIRASFGTTKYCNNFIRGVSCNNPDCVYLHELGDDDDRFTKEEIQVCSLCNAGQGSVPCQAGHSKLVPTPGQNQTIVTGNGGPSGTGKKPLGDPVFPPPVFIQDIVAPKHSVTNTSNNPHSSTHTSSKERTNWSAPGSFSATADNAIESNTDADTVITADTPTTITTTHNNTNQNNNSSTSKNNASSKVHEKGLLTVMSSGTPPLSPLVMSNEKPLSVVSTSTTLATNDQTIGSANKNHNNNATQSQSPKLSNSESHLMNTNNNNNNNNSNKNINNNNNNNNNNSESNQNDDKFLISQENITPNTVLHDPNLAGSDKNNSVPAASIGTVTTANSTTATSTPTNQNTNHLNSIYMHLNAKKPDMHSHPAYYSSFNGIGKCAVFPVPLSSYTISIWSTILTASTDDLKIDPFGNLVLPISEILDLTLPPVDAICLSPWPKPLQHYSRSNNHTETIGNDKNSGLNVVSNMDGVVR